MSGALGSKPLKVLHAGGGFVAPFHLAGWRALDGVEVVGLVAATEEEARTKATHFGVPEAFGQLDAALEQLQPDILDLATPATVRLEPIRAALSRGVHVLCQKPLAPDWETALAIAEVVRSHDARFMVHENFRFRPWYRAIKRLLDEGAIGTPFYCRLEARTAGTVRTASASDRPWIFGRQPYFATLDPLLILESAIHQVDVARFLFGNPQLIFARARSVSPEVRGEDLAILHLAFSGVDAVLERSYCSKGYPEPPLISEWGMIEGLDGTIFLDRDGRVRVVVDTPGERREWEQMVDRTDAYPRSYGAAIAHFVECLRTGAPFETGLDDNLATLRTTFSAYQSWASGDSVRLAGPISSERYSA